MLHARPAEKGDMPIILGFIGEAATWLADKGTDQWSKPWPDERQRDGRTWMVWDDGRNRYDFVPATGQPMPLDRRRERRACRLRNPADRVP